MPYYKIIAKDINNVHCCAIVKAKSSIEAEYKARKSKLILRNEIIETIIEVSSAHSNQKK
jgi:hypothetical protein